MSKVTNAVVKLTIEYVVPLPDYDGWSTYDVLEDFDGLAKVVKSDVLTNTTFARC